MFHKLSSESKKSWTYVNNDKAGKGTELADIVNGAAGVLLNSIVSGLLVMSAVNIVKSTMPNITCPYYVYLLVFIWSLIGGFINKIEWPDGRKWVRHAINLAFLLIFTIALLGIGWNNADKIRQGFYYVQGQFVKLINTYYGVSFSRPSGAKQFVGIFMGFAVAFIALIFHTLAMGTKRIRMNTIFPTVMLAAQLCVGQSPKVIDLSVYAICVLWCIIADLSDDRKIWKSMLYIAAATAVMAACVVAFEPVADSLAGKKPQMLAFQKNLESDIKSLFKSKRDIQDGIVTNNYPEYRDEVVMTVESVFQPYGNVYLRSYYGDTYSNGRWIRTVDFDSMKEAYTDASVRVARENAHGMSMMFFGEYSPDSYVTDNKYTVRMTGMTTEYAYLPYYINPDSIKTDSGVTFSDDYIITKSKDDYKVEANAGDSPYFSGNMEETEAYSDYVVDEYDDFYTSYNSFVKDNYIGDMQKSGPVELDARALLTSAGLTRSMMNTDSTSDNNANRIKAAYYVQQFLTSSQFKYSKNPPSANGQDIVENFLANSKKGFCVHFASAGTMILRQMGVPARYVSGYCAKNGSFKESGAGYVSGVKDSQSHAWVEIYLDNIGWIPVEMTPGYFISTYNQFDNVEISGNTSDSADNSNTGNSETSDSQMTESASGEMTDSQIADSAAGSDSQSNSGGSGNAGGGDGNGSEKGNGNGNGSGRNIGIIIKILVPVVLCLAFIFVLIYSRYQRQLLWKARLKLHESRGRYSKAAIMINNRIYRSLGHFTKKNTDRQYLALLKKTYCGPQYCGIHWNEYMKIVQKAVYSRDGISAEEYAVVKEVWKHIKPVKECR